MDRTSIFTASVALPAEPPEWVHLMPLGAIEGRDGRRHQLGDAQAVIAASQALAMDWPIDFDHAMDLAAPGTQAPAAGWIKELQARADGIWGRVEWTERGAAAVKAKEYRYLSPVYDVAKKTDEIVRIRRAGLTNNPALYLQAVTASSQRKEDSMPNTMTAVAKALGQKEDADEKAIVAAAETVAQQHSEATSALAVIAQAAGIAIDTAPDELATAIAEKIKDAAAPDPAKYVSTAAFNELAKKHEDLAKSIGERDAAAAVDTAIAAGKLTPAERDWGLRYARRDPEDFAVAMAKRPAIFRPGSDVPKGDPKPGADGLTEDERQVARALGVGTEAYAKELGRQREKETA
ncbi:MAG: phage protease [Alphaproteobacteria bacterium]